MAAKKPATKSRRGIVNKREDTIKKRMASSGVNDALAQARKQRAAKKKRAASKK